jgi:choline kinase
MRPRSVKRMRASSRPSRPMAAPGPRAVAPAPEVAMTAVILAAGVARRLAPLTDRTQKSLLLVGGRPMLARMLEALDAAGVRRVEIVVGHCADQVMALTESSPLGMRVRHVFNDAYQKGSAISLHAAADTIRRRPTLIMDADVVFPRVFLSRLIASEAPNALLRDRGFADTGEEVKIYTRRGRVVALGKKAMPKAWDETGEGVGFFKCGQEAGRQLVGRLEQVIAESGGLAEYEDALHLLVRQHRVRAVDVTGLPWTEVDFAEDLHRARMEVLPAIVRLEGS